GLSPKKRLSVVSERKSGADQCKPPSTDLLVTIALRSSPVATQMKYKPPSRPKDSQGSEFSASPSGPPWQNDSPGMITCCQRLPPSMLTAAPIPTKRPPIHAVTRFLEFFGFTATEHSFSAPFEPHSAKTSGSERSLIGPTRKSLACAARREVSA